MTSLALLVGATESLAPNARTVAAVFPPWWSPADVIAAGARHGAVLSAGAAPGVVIVRGNGPGLAARLRRDGALLTLNPLAARGCGPDRSPPHG